MPALDPTDKPPDDLNLAVMAESLYLVNLLLLPGLAFLLLVGLYVRKQHHCSPLCACHLQQTLRASIWAGVLIVVVTAGIALLGGHDQPATWVALIIYFTTVHASLVLLGVVGLARALAGRHYHYPLIGTPCPGESAS